jgi:hypothetical protein
MPNLRELVESDLAVTLEGDFGLPVELIDPNGVKYDGINGQILYETVTVNPETVEQMVVNDPIVSLRRASLTRIPIPGEMWTVRIPTSPSRTAEKENFIINWNHPPTGGASIGFIRLHLQRISQL